MNKEITRLKNIRIYLLDLVKDLSTEQLNEIPEGFNNNIIWNLAHLLATQQGICYIRAGIKTYVDEKYFLTYKPNTIPEQLIDTANVEAIKQLFVSAIDRFEIDYENKLFSNYGSWMAKPYGVEVINIDEAIKFLLFHEGLHAGYIMAMKRLLKNKR